MSLLTLKPNPIIDKICRSIGKIYNKANQRYLLADQ